MPRRRADGVAPPIGPFRIVRDGEPGYAAVCPRCSLMRGWAQHHGAQRAIDDAVSAGLEAYRRATVGTYAVGAAGTCKCGPAPTVSPGLDV